MIEPARQIKSTQAGTVLLVEDEQIVADIYQLGLGRAGYEVLVANSGPTGLDLAEAGRPQFIFLDVRMPGMDGVEVLKQLSIGVGGGRCVPGARDWLGRPSGDIRMGLDTGHPGVGVVTGRTFPAARFRG